MEVPYRKIKQQKNEGKSLDLQNKCPDDVIILSFL